MIRKKNVDAARAAYAALEKNGLRVKSVIAGKAEDYSVVVHGDRFSVVPKSSITAQNLMPKAIRKGAEMEPVIVCAAPGKQYALNSQRRGKRFSAAMNASIIKP